MLDLGLLGAMSDVQAKDILIENSIFSEYKGAFTEQYVAQQMISAGEKPFMRCRNKKPLQHRLPSMQESLRCQGLKKTM